MLKIAVVTLFPEFFQHVLSKGVTTRAFKDDKCQLELISLRECSTYPHKQVDDRPFGGGPGMVLMPDVLEQALFKARDLIGHDARTIILSPVGKRIHQQDLQKTAQEKIPTVFFCGRYEGFDQRFIDHYADESWCLGDFVLSGGEIAALACIDGILRLLPGVLSCDQSAQFESFQDNCLDYPHYTRPKIFAGREVPDVLLSGHHKLIAQWRQSQAIKLTHRFRPDLIDNNQSSDQ